MSGFFAWLLCLFFFFKSLCGSIDYSFIIFPFFLFQHLLPHQSCCHPPISPSLLCSSFIHSSLLKWHSNRRPADDAHSSDPFTNTDATRPSLVLFGLQSIVSIIITCDWHWLVSSEWIARGLGRWPSNQVLSIPCVNYNAHSPYFSGIGLVISKRTIHPVPDVDAMMLVSKAAAWLIVCLYLVHNFKVSIHSFCLVRDNQPTAILWLSYINVPLLSPPFSFTCHQWMASLDDSIAIEYDGVGWMIRLVENSFVCQPSSCLMIYFVWMACFVKCHGLVGKHEECK
jgi:hypothetical protein